MDCDCASQGWPFVRFAERKEITTTGRINHDSPIILIVIVQVRVSSLHISCASASLACVLHTLLTPKAIEIHIHGGPWLRN